jgi:hypothetical protein
VCGLLERFSGYTYETLMAEDVELLRLVQIEAMGRPEGERGQVAEQLQQMGYGGRL